MTRLARPSVAACIVALAFLTAAPAAGAFEARGSVEQVYVTGAKRGATLLLVDRAGRRVASRRADARGAVLFRGVRPGTGYRVRRGGETSKPLTVLTTKAAPPRRSLYDQQIPTSGYGYLTTRDGTKLAFSVRPPQDGTSASAETPSPTLIEYSGYGYANPAGPNSGIAAIANLMGFTVVDVNMRGTGCSGGAFDYFEPLQNLDGYDVIETVARQPWVARNRVGMMGISYGGISQLFTAQLRPPSLAAIAPLSVVDATATTLYPGGVLNTGFAVPWATERENDASPAGPDTGQPWAYKRIQEGDEVCKDNQALHGQAANLQAKIRANDHYDPRVADPLAPATFVDRINVPTFLACQWQDEQTGGHCPALAARMTGTKRKWFTFTNGTHIDSLAPETFNRWFDFLQLYVARRAPKERADTMRAAAPLLYQRSMGIGGVNLPRDPIQEQPTYEGALAEFQKQPPVRILFDNGAGGEPGKPHPGFEKSFASFPIPGTRATTWFFSNGGRLRGEPASGSGADAFTWNPRARSLTNFTGNTSAGENGLWTQTPPYKWQQHPAGGALSYLTDPLTANTAVVGGGAVRAWVRSTRPDADLQATITEVRPDGRETFVQSGWLRADARKLDARRSTPLEPVLSLRERDAAPLPRDRFVRVTIPLYYQGHAYRAGSRIRVTISAPNGDQPVWAFAKVPKGKGTVAVARSRAMPSSLVLPVIPGVEVPTPLPPCPGLRAQPCRDYSAIANRSASR